MPATGGTGNFLSHWDAPPFITRSWGDIGAQPTGQVVDYDNASEVADELRQEPLVLCYEYLGVDLDSLALAAAEDLIAKRSQLRETTTPAEEPTPTGIPTVYVVSQRPVDQPQGRVSA